jgi:hypothetical protein
MNKERMLKLADEIEKPTLDIGFNMGDFHNGSGPKRVGDLHCGTTCCIAGIACLLFGEEGDYVDSENAARLLGLSQDQANKLVYNFDGYIVDKNTKRFTDITRQQAATAIRRMVQEEGNV